MIGKTISHYRITEKLGEGGMGVVFKAEDVTLKRTIALKFLPREWTRDPEARARFLREAQAAAALNHPNICTVHEISEADDQIFIAMECVEGEDLKTAIRSTPLALRDALDIAIQIAEGLAAAHERDIVHRDIKPANIIVTPKGHVKIMDFGLARMADGAQLTMTGTTVGTVAYMSPEQARGGDIDHRTDIWSLGVVLYEMVAGRRPFRGDRDQAVIYSILNHEPDGIADSAAGCPAEITRALARALAKDPGARYQSAGNLAADLGAIRQRLVSDLTVVASAQAEALPSIAVLPFANMSPDAENDYFGDGLAEELANALARLPGLRVAARTSAFQFRGKDTDAREIGERLNVGTILEGSVRRVGKQLRVTAQLVSAPDGFQLWSKRYDREMTDIFAVQDEITAAIVGQLKIRLSPESKERVGRRDTGNVDAYSLYLEGRYYWNSLTPEGLKRSRECYERAIVIDPNYAPAHAALSMWHQSVAFWADVPPQGAFAKSRAAAEQALEIDETSPLAHNCLAVVYAMHDWDWERAEPEFKRAIELDPSSPFGHLNYAYLLRDQGRHGDALRESGIARRLDPLSTVVTSWAAALSVAAGHIREGISELETIASRDPDAWQPHMWLGQAYTHAGARDRAIASAKRAAEGAPGVAVTMAMLACSYYLGDRPADGDRLLRELREKAEHGYVSPTLLAWVHVARDAVDEAVECAERAYKEHDHWLPATRVNPPGMRFEDPRLASILSKAGRDPHVEGRGQTSTDPQLSMPAPTSVMDVAGARQAPSIAVLPFADMSPAKDQEYFCDGMAEELINALTNIEGLQVCSRTSAFQFKGQGHDIHEIGRKLNVQTVLEGSVRKAGTRLRITAQLIKVADGYHLWSERFDRDMEDVFAIQDEISLAIVDRLKVRLLGEEKAKLVNRHTENLDAYNLYLRGRWFWNRRTDEGLGTAIECFESAIKVAPDYALAYAGMADAYNDLLNYSLSPPKDACQKAKEAALKALELDDALPEAHAALGVILSEQEWDWDGAEREFGRALELNANCAVAHHGCGMLRSYRRQHDEAIESMKRALELDPLSLPFNRNAAVVLERAGRYDEALEVAKRATEMDPDFMFVHLIQGIIYSAKSMYEEALTEYELEERAFGGRYPLLDASIATVYAKSGRTQDAERILDDLRSAYPHSRLSPFCVALVCVALGRKDEGFEWLERSYEERERYLRLVALMDKPSMVGGDPRLAALLKKMGLLR